MKKLILLRPYQTLPAGAPMEVTSGVAQLLIQRGIARLADEKDKRGRK